MVDRRVEGSGQDCARPERGLMMPFAQPQLRLPQTFYELPKDCVMQGTVNSKPPV